MKATYWRMAAVALFSVIALAGCSYDGAQVNAFLNRPRAKVSGVEYRCLPPDILAIDSVHVPEISSHREEIRPDGRINLPLLGEIEVAGKTPKEIEEAINAKAAQYYEQVDSTVTVSVFNSQKFYVYGEVAVGGAVVWTGTNTLLDALAVAKPTFLAWPERITVVRGDDPQVGGYATSQPSKKYHDTGIYPAPVDKPRKVMVINLMAMIKEGDTANNIMLLPNDVVYVQPNPLAKIGMAIQTLLLPVSPAVQTVVMPGGAIRSLQNN